MTPARPPDKSCHGGIPLTAIYIPGRDDPILLDTLYDSTLIKTLDEMRCP